MDEQFDIYDYLSGLTGFYVDKSVLKRIAMERGIINATNLGDIDQRTKELCTADILFAIYMSPTSTPTSTKKHGNFSQTIGSQTINSKKDLWNLCYFYYKKWEDEKVEELQQVDEGLQWLEC